MSHIPRLIRDAEEGDLPAILEIHNNAVLTTTAIWSIHPADLEGRRAFIAERRAKGFPFLVATEAGVLLGYASFGDFRPHDGYARTVEHSIYVHKDHQRKGVARSLLPQLIAAAVRLGKHAIIGGIDATNAASIALHQQFGFEIVGRLPEVGFKFGRYLDLLFLEKILADSP